MENEQQVSGQQELAVTKSWGGALKEIGCRIGGRFARSEGREQALRCLRGLLNPVGRKNSWQLAEALGEPTPYRIQHLLGRALWDTDAVRDDLQQYVVDYLSHPEAILVVDETGFLKKSRHSASVARQYSGTAGRVDNCQIGVFPAYASVQGHTLVDRELYLPQEWTADPARGAQAGIPADQAFATKPTLARQMLGRAFEAGIPAAWITGDPVYGDDRRLRLWLEEQGRAYVLAVSGREHIWMGFQQVRVKELLADLPDDGWIQLSAGDGAKGPRWYDWLLMPANRPLQEGWRRWVLVRRKVDDPTELTAFVVFAPAATELEMLVHVAGSRWSMEVALEAAKGEVGLDHYEVRSWRGWYRHVTLAMWAQTLLTVLQAAAVEDKLPKKGALLPASTRSLAAFRRSRGLASG